MKVKVAIALLGIFYFSYPTYGGDPKFALHRYQTREVIGKINSLKEVFEKILEKLQCGMRLNALVKHQVSSALDPEIHLSSAHT